MCDSGLTDTVMTVYELREGESTEGEGFIHLPLFLCVGEVRVVRVVRLYAPMMASTGAHSPTNTVSFIGCAPYLRVPQPRRAGAAQGSASDGEAGQVSSTLTPSSFPCVELW